jgi:hypothetical protein
MRIKRGEPILFDVPGGHVRVYRDGAGEWRWTRFARNGSKVGNGGEGYRRRGVALRQARKLNA